MLRSITRARGETSKHSGAQFGLAGWAYCTVREAWVAGSYLGEPLYEEYAGTAWKFAPTNDPAQWRFAVSLR